jgi:hypothetical protein
LPPGIRRRSKGPRQPIFFRHDIHAGQYKIDCQYCHSSVTISTEPGIPSVQTCMGCHAAIAGTDSSAKREIRKLRTFWNNREHADSGQAGVDPDSHPGTPRPLPAHASHQGDGAEGLRDLSR